MPSTLGDRFGQALRQAGYTYDAVAELLGPEAHAALGRNETTPGERRTRGGDPVSTLTRLFLLQLPVSRDAAEVALPGLVEPLAVEGIVAHSVGEVSARLDVRPYAAASAGAVGDLWVVSDLTPGLDGTPNRVDPDHVLGISSASTSLAQLTLRTPVATAVDLGSGCGVLSLHLAAHSRRVIATDVNPRALWLTGFNAELNGLTSIETRAGSLFDPLAGERVDLITSNPPFVISPATGEPLVYRDSGLPGDRVVEEIVRTAPAHLTPGGWCQVLANWAILRHRPWEERVLDWVPPGCDAFVVQREVLDPAGYVELWLKDSGHHGGSDYRERYDTWLAWLEDQQVEGIGFGWINLRAGGGPGPAREALDWPHAVQQPIAPAVAAWASARDALAASPDLTATRPQRAEDVVQETRGEPGAADPQAIVLRQDRRLRRARLVDTATAALVGACDGDLTVGQIIGALAHLLDRPVADLARDLLPVVGELVAEGYLVLPATIPPADRRNGHGEAETSAPR